MKLFFVSFISSLIIIGDSFFLSEKQSMEGFPRYGCGRDGHCSMIISVLRDPRLMPAWTTKANAWNKAIEQMHAYHQLFSSENEEEAEENSAPDSEDENENLSSIESSSASSRSKRFLPIFTPKRHRPAREDNMYWLIRMPGK